MIEYMTLAFLLSLLVNCVLWMKWRDSEQRWNRRNEEPRVLYMPEIETPADEEMLANFRESALRPTPTIEDKIAASFPPDPVHVTISTPLPRPDMPAMDCTVTSTATVPVKQADVVPIKRRKRRKARG